jgi:hypothetical protein
METPTDSSSDVPGELANFKRVGKGQRWSTVPAAVAGYFAGRLHPELVDIIAANDLTVVFRTNVGGGKISVTLPKDVACPVCRQVCPGGGTYSRQNMCVHLK